MNVRKLLLYAFLLSPSLILAQTTPFAIKSAVTRMKVVNDSTAPTLTLEPVRNIEKGFRLLQRDTMITLSGAVFDDGGLMSFLVNGVAAKLTPSGKFRVLVHLSRGENLVHFRAMDKKRNVADTTFVVFQDPTADTTAPQINIIQPSLGRGIMMVAKTPTMRISGTFSDASPLASLTINNMIPDSIREGRFYCDLPTDSLRVVSIRAVDSCGNVSMDSLVLPRHYFEGEVENLDLPTTGRYFALLIGVDRYKYAENLKNPTRDAGQLKTILSTQYTFDEENIILLKNPTRDKILEGFEQVKQKVGSEDNLLVFYAGHGFVDKDANQGYWWPTDANPSNHSQWISNSDIRDQVKRIKSKHTLLIADACFSGSVFNKMRDGAEYMPVPIVEAFRKASRTALTSGEGAVPDESVFTRLLFQSLETNPNRYLKANALAYRLSEDVLTNSPNRQQTEYGKIQEADDLGGDFVFVKRHVEKSKPIH